MSLPGMVIETVNTITTDFGFMPLPESKLLTDQQSFSMDVLDTDDPIMEGFFLPWMQEVTSDTYVYKHRPFMKADISVTYFITPFLITEGNTERIAPVSFLRYNFHGCYPYDIGSR